MKKLLLKIIFLSVVVLIPAAVMAQVQVRINVPLPPPIIFPAPPHVVVIPETDVYAVPDVDADIYFYGGWWWRPWEGRWYRSHYYDRGWGYYKGTPSFHRQVPPGWRNDYRDRRWRGHEWDHRPIPYREAERNWSNWKRDRHWEKENYYGVKGMDRGPRDRGQYRDRQDRGPDRGRDRGPDRGDRGDHERGPHDGGRGDRR